MKYFQVAIIGGGVLGSALARELSQFEVNVAVFEMGSDVATGASKANSGVIHSGINSPPSSLKAKFCIEGNTMIQSLADDLSIPLDWVGKFIVAKHEDEIRELKRLKNVGTQNGVPSLKIFKRLEVNKKELNISCIAALWVPSAGITLPYRLTIALAENAAENDVKFFLETKVIGMKKLENTFLINTTKGEYQAQIIVNAAGINCRDIVSLLEEPDFQVYPCRGEYLVLDKKYSSLVHSMIYPVPEKELGVLGIHITPTIEGNLLVGPSAESIDKIDDTRTTKTTMKLLLQEARNIIPTLPDNAVINAYSGIRCKLTRPGSDGGVDFRIEESKLTPGLINLLGIESPGLTAAPAIAKEVTRMISNHIELKKKNNYKGKRIKRKRFITLSPKEQTNLIKKDKRWGRIICRCEHVTEAEVSESLSNPLNARTLSSVKYRCRAGMGRCQGGFCTQHIIRILEDEFHMNITDMKLKSPQSYLFYTRTRGKP